MKTKHNKKEIVFHTQQHGTGSPPRLTATFTTAEIGTRRLMGTVVARTLKQKFVFTVFTFWKCFGKKSFSRNPAERDYCEGELSKPDGNGPGSTQSYAIVWLVVDDDEVDGRKHSQRISTP